MKTPEQKGFGLLGLLIVIAIVVTGGYWMWKGKTVTPSSNVPPPTSNLQDWETYKNDKYGFEFKYPPELKGNIVGDQFMGSISGQSVNLLVHVVSNKNSGLSAMSLISRTFNDIQVQEYSNKDSRYIYIFLSKYAGEWIEFYAELPYVNTDQILDTFRFINK